MISKINIEITAEELQEMINQGLRSAIKEVAQLRMQEPENKDELLTRDDLLKMLKIGETTLWKMMRDGKIPYKRVGKRVLFSKNEILKEISNLNNSWRKYE